MNHSAEKTDRTYGSFLPPSSEHLAKQPQNGSDIAQAAEIRSLQSNSKRGGGPKSSSSQAHSSSVLQAKELRTLAGSEALGRGARPASEASATHAIADSGLTGAGQTLPHMDRVQRSFQPHDLSSVKAHTDSRATQAASELGASAYTKGEQIVFGHTPDLATVAHEAAHVVQQRKGVRLPDGVGTKGDRYERQAEVVADRVVADQPSADLLSSDGASATGEAVQHKKTTPPKSALVGKIRKEANRWRIWRSHDKIFGWLSKTKAADWKEMAADTTLMDRFLSIFSIGETSLLLKRLNQPPVFNAKWLAKTGKANQVKLPDLKLLCWGAAQQQLDLIESADFETAFAGLKKEAPSIALQYLVSKHELFHRALRTTTFASWVWSKPKGIGPSLYSAAVKPYDVAVALNAACQAGHLDVALKALTNAAQAKQALAAASMAIPAVAQKLQAKAASMPNVADLTGDPKAMTREKKKKRKKVKETHTEHRSADPALDKKGTVRHMPDGKNARVKVIRGKNNPLVSPSATDAQLFKRGKGVKVNTIDGSAKKPCKQVRYDSKLFLGSGEGQPVIQDIKQGSIGDCYFLAALSHMVAQDPTRIKRVMTLQGDKATTVLHHWKGRRWEPAIIQTNLNLLRLKGKGGKIVGAQPRVDNREKTEKRRWYADLQGKQLVINRETFFDAAMWVPLVEKAWIRFAQQYGKYGVKGGDDKKSPYNVVNKGGLGRRCLSLFYGNSTSGSKIGKIKYTPTGNSSGLDPNLLSQNRALLLQLVNLKKPTGQPKTMVFASSHDEAIPRLEAQIGVVLSSPEGRALPRSQRRKLLYTAGRVGRYNSANGKNKKKLHDQIVKRCTWHIRKRGRYRINGLHADNAPAKFKQLLELMVTLSRRGVDSGRKGNKAGNPGQRFIEPKHAYAVLAAAFKDSSGNALERNRLRTILQGNGNIPIDPTKSTVNLHNPWRHGEPDPRLKGIADNKNDGSFQLKLDQYLRTFTHQGSIQVQ